MKIKNIELRATGTTKVGLDIAKDIMNYVSQTRDIKKITQPNKIEIITLKKHTVKKAVLSLKGEYWEQVITLNRTDGLEYAKYFYNMYSGSNGIIRKVILGEEDITKKIREEIFRGKIIQIVQNTLDYCPDMDSVSYIPTIFDHQCNNLIFVGMLVVHDKNIAETVILNINGDMFCKIKKELKECGVSIQIRNQDYSLYNNSMFTCEPVSITDLDKELNPFKLW